jgi:hypothetical protein
MKQLLTWELLTVIRYCITLSSYLGTAHSDSLLHHLVIPYRKDPALAGDASDRESGFVLAFLDSRFCGNDKKEAVNNYRTAVR